jgi:hypothetical protein
MKNDNFAKTGSSQGHERRWKRDKRGVFVSQDGPGGEEISVRKLPYENKFGVRVTRNAPTYRHATDRPGETIGGGGGSRSAPALESNASLHDDM